MYRIVSYVVKPCLSKHMREMVLQPFDIEMRDRGDRKRERERERRRERERERERRRRRRRRRRNMQVWLNRRILQMAVV